MNNSSARGHALPVVPFFSSLRRVSLITWAVLLGERNQPLQTRSRCNEVLFADELRCRQPRHFVRQLLEQYVEDSSEEVVSVFTASTMPLAFLLAFTARTLHLELFISVVKFSCKVSANFALVTVLAANPHGLNLQLVIPLALSCLSIMIILPIAAARSRLHIPGWVGFALFSFVLSYTCARISGVHGYIGRTTGVFFSILCFLFLAAALGSVIALFFYRDPPGL